MISRKNAETHKISSHWKNISWNQLSKLTRCFHEIFVNVHKTKIFTDLSCKTKTPCNLEIKEVTAIFTAATVSYLALTMSILVTLHKMCKSFPQLQTCKKLFCWRFYKISRKKSYTNILLKRRFDRVLISQSMDSKPLAKILIWLISWKFYLYFPEWIIGFKLIPNLVFQLQTNFVSIDCDVLTFRFPLTTAKKWRDSRF